MWTIQCEASTEARRLHFTVKKATRPTTIHEVSTAWQNDPDFRTLFNAALADVPYSAFRWETPALAAATASIQPFEFVLLDSPDLIRRPNPHDFAAHFKSGQESVVTFPNLSGDAILVVPSPIADQSCYGHLAAFVRHAPEQQRHQFWQTVGAALQRRLGTKPVWLSTAGAGVPWLHVRLDDKPKYYRFAPYRQWNPTPTVHANPADP